MPAVSFKKRVLRLSVQAVCYVVEGVMSITDGIMNRCISLFFKTKYVRRGACQNTGQCCRMVGMAFPKSWHNWPRLIALTKKWHDLRYNFEFLGQVDNMLVYECRYITKDNKCAIHRFKPKLCRDYPQTPWFGFTKVYKGCGYWFENRKASGFEKVLNRSIHAKNEITTGYPPFAPENSQTVPPQIDNPTGD